MIRITKKNSDCIGSVNLPTSKSISNRLLILQFYYNNSFQIDQLSVSDDTLLLSSTLDLIRQYKIRGDSGLLRIDARNAGTVMRFLIPLLCVTRGHFLLTGTERMKHRPVSGLVEALRDTGAEIDYVEKIGYPPLLIRGRAITGGRIVLDASLSSQFITALLLMAPTLDDGLTVELKTEPVSWPYVKMTTGLLSALGVQVIVQGNAIRVYYKQDIDTNVSVESDWSGSSFWYCMTALSKKGDIIMPNLRKSGLQGDQQVSSLFREIGVDTLDLQESIRIVKSNHIVDNYFVDFNEFPDLALPVITACAANGIPAKFTGLERLKIKESDRLEALTAGLGQIGISFREESNNIWTFSGNLQAPRKILIDDFGDHRVAMAFASLALKGFEVIMEHPEVVDKSYPGFWNDLRKIGFSCDLFY